MTDKVYDQVFTQLIRDYKFVIKNGRSNIQLRMKVISVMSWQTGLMGICQAKI